MSSSNWYPGVYDEANSSGIRPIVGAGTSDTAFIGNFSRGVMNRAVRVMSFAEFEHQFGGLRRDSEASYAVHQYYRNGGSVAWIVRVAGGTPRAASRMFRGDTADSFTATASSEGTWGNEVQVGITRITGSTTTFHLAVRELADTATGKAVVASEVYRDVSTDAQDPRFVERVAASSKLVRITLASPAALPVATGFSDVTSLAVSSDPTNASFVSLGEDPATAGSDGSLPDRSALLGSAPGQSGIHALADIAPYGFNLMCLPDAGRIGETDDDGYRDLIAAAQQFCFERRAFLIVDPAPKVRTASDMVMLVNGGHLPRHRNAAVYWPRLEIADPLDDGRPRNVGSSGTIAGCYARTDASRGFWKAAAGTEASLHGAAIVTTVDNLDHGTLNRVGVNVLRTVPGHGPVSWGARTLDGADGLGAEWKFVPVRRTALFIEESLLQGLQWVVFEPNGELLWSRIRLDVGSFLHDLFRQGAFRGSTPRDAYFVRCESTTTTPADIELGIVNLVVGFAPLKPAEFVVIEIQQRTEAGSS